MRAGTLLGLLRFGRRGWGRARLTTVRSGSKTMLDYSCCLTQIRPMRKRSSAASVAIAVVIVASGYVAYASDNDTARGGADHDPGSAQVILFAQVESDGRINASSGGIPSALPRYKSAFLVDFQRNVTRCAAVASDAALPIYAAAPGATSPRAVGQAVVSMFASGYTFPNGFPSADTVQVETYNEGKPVHAPFTVIVAC